MAILCPNCGSPVIINCSQWECGWCGDFGDISSLSSSERAKLTRLIDEELRSLERGIGFILDGVKEHFGDGEDEMNLVCELTVYGMSHALCPESAQTQRNLWMLNEFFNRYTFCTAHEVFCAARSGKPAFEDKFVLTEERLGSFWESILQKLPVYDEHREWPSWLFNMVSGLSGVEAFFSDVDSTNLLEEFQRALGAHWSGRRILSPDRIALERAVREWDFSENEQACRDLLIAVFPETVRCWTPQELLAMDTGELLKNVGERDPETGIRMMKFLLDAAEPHLQDPGAAQLLLEDDVYDLCCNQAVQARLLVRLKDDERLANQLFLSAYAGNLQTQLLDACNWFGEEKLGEHLRELMEQNPFCDECD